MTTLGIRCFSHADIGLDRRVGSDGLNEWLGSGATGLDQVAPVPPFQRLPVQALLDHGADALLLLVAGESGSPFERAASMFGGIVQESTGIPVHVAALEFGLERFRDATTKFVQGLGMGRASEAGVLVGVGPGAAQLTLGTILGSLAASPSVSLIHCVSGARIDHAVVPDPSTWLERRRFFERLAQLADANGDEQRALAIREMDAPLIHLDDHIRLEAEFFDAVARGSVRSVVMGRAWLTSGYLARGGLMAMDRSNRPSLGVTLALIPADTPLAARTFLKTFAFLNPIATGNAGHRARELRYANERRLSKHEREGGLERAGLPVRRFRATPSGLVHVVRCVGEREMLEGAFPFVDAVLQGRDLVLSRVLHLDDGQLTSLDNDPSTQVRVRHSLVHSEETQDAALRALGYLRANGLPLQDALLVSVADPADAARCRDEVRIYLTPSCDPPTEVPDALVVLFGPGSQEMQIGALLAAAQYAIDWGVPLHVGAMRQNQERTLIDIPERPSALMTGWTAALLPLARELIERLELPAARDVLHLIGPEGAVLAMKVDAFWESLGLGLTGDPANPLRTAQVLRLIRRQLGDLDPALAISLGYLACERTSPGPCLRQAAEAITALREARNTLAITHGQQWRPPNARRLLRNVEEELAVGRSGEQRSHLVVRHAALVTEIDKIGEGAVGSAPVSPIQP